MTEAEDMNVEAAKKEGTVYAPVEGTAIPYTEIANPTFRVQGARTGSRNCPRERRSDGSL